MIRHDLRKLLRNRRQALSPLLRMEMSQAVCQQIKISQLIQTHQKIALYTAFGSEVDLSSLITYIKEIKADVYLPLVPEDGRILSFSALHEEGYWKKNRFGILEWMSQAIITPTALDVVFVPLIGFDLQGNRLGQGGGYYDASFHFLNQTIIKKPRLIGVAFECQRVDNIPIASWDIRLEGIFTEKTYYNIVV